MGWFFSNNYLSRSQMENNAQIIKDYLSNKGWNLNSICAVLGNMESESTINPGIWQNLQENNMSGGFGLVQWTPATNFTNWADSHGYSWTDGNAQLKWIDEETTSFGQWIPTDTYNFSFEAFKNLNETPEYLASAFLKNFERAGVEVEEQRRSQAKAWKSFFSSGGSTNPDPETPSNPSKKRKKFNFLLFNPQRRRML